MFTIFFDYNFEKQKKITIHKFHIAHLNETLLYYTILFYYSITFYL